MAEQELTGRVPGVLILARLAYTALLYLLLPFVFIKLAWRARRAPAYWLGWSERLGFFPAQYEADRATIWIHAVSVGEVQAAVPVVAGLRARFPKARFVVSCTTPTGKAHANRVFGKDALIGYVPYDLPGAVRRFLMRVQPHVAIFMETELWPNLYHACASRNIPVIIANARMSERSAAGYHRFRWLTTALWPHVKHVAAQTEPDAQRFRYLGMPADRVTVTGTVKFDITVSTDVVSSGLALRERWGMSRPVWIAASTHAGEDDSVLAAHARIREAVPDCLLILVPRHPERFDAVDQLCRKSGYRVSRHTAKDVSADTEIYLGDTMGELLLYFAAADVAFVGGSLVPVGGHNLLEPASLGMPVVTGPHTFNFAEVASLLENAEALRRVNNETELATTVINWISDPTARLHAGTAGKAAVTAHRGATQRLCNIVVECCPELS